jgi:hypothetical protein
VSCILAGRGADMNSQNAFAVINPFPKADADRHEIWDVLVRNDFDTFVACDWLNYQADFWIEGFFGVDARNSLDPSNWRLTFPDVDSYGREWQRQAKKFSLLKLSNISIRRFLFESCKLEDVEVIENRGIARKTFDGRCETVDGGELMLRFQSLYKLSRIDRKWKIAGFIGYLPYQAQGDANSLSELVCDNRNDGLSSCIP